MVNILKVYSLHNKFIQLDNYLYFIDIGTLKHGIHAYEKILIMTIWQWYKILKYMYMCIIDIKYILKNVISL